MPSVTTTILSARILDSLSKILVFRGLCNTNWEGEIRQVGDSVKIAEIGPVSLTPYVKKTPLVYEEISDASKILTADQCSSFSFSIDATDQAKVLPSYMDKAAKKAALAIGDAVDSHIAGKMRDEAGITDDDLGASSAVEVTSNNVLEIISLIGRLLSENSVPRMGRFVTIPSWLYQKLVLAKAYFETPNTQVLSDSFIGRILGLDVYESQNCPVSGEDYSIIAGIPAATTYAEKLSEVQTLTLPDQFELGCRGLIIFGSRVVLPDAILLAILKEGSES